MANLRVNQTIIREFCEKYIFPPDFYKFIEQNMMPVLIKLGLDE